MLFLIPATIKYVVKSNTKINAVHLLFALFQACDTVDNVDQEVYEQMSQCAAYVLEVNTQIKLLIKCSNNKFRKHLCRN